MEVSTKTQVVLSHDNRQNDSKQRPAAACAVYSYALNEVHLSGLSPIFVHQIPKIDHGAVLPALLNS